MVLAKVRLKILDHSSLKQPADFQISTIFLNSRERVSTWPSKSHFKHQKIKPLSTAIASPAFDAMNTQEHA